MTVRTCGVASLVGAVLLAKTGAAEPLVSIARSGKLVYTPDAGGNRIPDFSRCGYRGGGVAIPDVPVGKTLKPSGDRGDDTKRIQEAIDELAQRRPDKNGFRGALLLERGLYRVSGTLTVRTSGVVIRGDGQQPGGTVLLATGRKQRPVIVLRGDAKTTEIEGSRRRVSENYVPWGASSLSLESARGISAGDAVIVYRPSTGPWIHDIKMDRIVERAGTRQWRAGDYDLRFARSVTAVEGSTITLDAPIVNALDAKYGGGFVFRYREEGRIRNVGVEHLRVISEYERGRENDDEDHAWTGVIVDDAANAWVRNVTTVHLSHGVSLKRGARFVTVQDCACLAPVSHITGSRRYAFSINGQCCLMQRCYSADSRHAASTGSRVCGPNVFLDCLAERTHNDTGPHHRWAVGILWDNLKGGDFNAQDRGNYGSGHGWAGAQQVFWNCETRSICVQKPPTAQNYAIGCTGEITSGRFEDRQPGHYESHGKHVRPRSLYLKQLEERLGRRAVKNVTTRAQRQGTVYGRLKKKFAR